jgi:hypothetical protein
MKGKHFDSDATVCEGYTKFIAKTGSLTLLGKVGECDPPYLVLPLTIEPSKPRLLSR